VPATFLNRISKGGDAQAVSFLGEIIYSELFTKHPERLDYFNSVDTDVLTLCLAQTLDHMAKHVNHTDKSASSFRKVVDHLNDMHQRIGIPSWAVPIMGSLLIDILQPFFQREEKLANDEAVPVTEDELEEAFVASITELPPFHDGVAS
jgi:hemoglobin-like flavoprotein